MTQWFRGELEGHYVGTRAGAPAVSQYGNADRFRLRIYRALVRHVEVLEQPEAPEGEPGRSEDPIGLPFELPDGCFYQAEVADTRILGLRPHTCLEGHIYEVAVSNPQITHSTQKGDKLYGRIVGEIYGRFLFPEAASEKRAESEMVELSTNASEGDAAPESDIEPLHPPDQPSEAGSGEPGQLPFVMLTAIVALILGFSGGGLAAAIWFGVLVPIFVIRVALGRQFEVDKKVRAFGVTLILLQVACLALMLGAWWMSGCKSLVVPMLGIVATTFLAGLLPSKAPVMCTAGGLALTLCVFFGDVGTHCEAPPTWPTLSPVDVDPARTNADGSWPKRNQPSGRAGE